VPPGPVSGIGLFGFFAGEFRPLPRQRAPVVALRQVLLQSLAGPNGRA
jgi:hypothetical protein